jgi:hypothetical protein
LMPMANMAHEGRSSRLRDRRSLLGVSSPVVATRNGAFTSFPSTLVLSPHPLPRPSFRTPITARGTSRSERPHAEPASQIGFLRARWLRYKPRQLLGALRVPTEVGFVRYFLLATGRPGSRLVFETWRIVDISA